MNIRRYIFPFLLLSICMYAQQTHLEMVGKPTKIGSGIIEERDFSKRYCAAIKVIFNLGYLTYDAFDGVVKVERKTGYDLVYLTPDEQVLEIFHSGHDPLKLILNDIGIQMIAQDLWSIQLQGEGDIIEIQAVTIIAHPPGATIIIDQDERISPASYRLPVGNHQIHIEKADYHVRNEQIEVTRQNQGVSFEFTLEKKALASGLLNIRTIPENSATVVIKNSENMEPSASGITPFQVTLNAGTYIIKVSKAEYIDKEIRQNFTFTKNRDEAVTILLDKPIYTLAINGTPGADVYIDHVLAGTIPIKDYEIEVGTKDIEVVKTWYQIKQARIIVDKNKELTFNLKEVSKGKTFQAENYRLTQKELSSVDPFWEISGVYSRQKLNDFDSGNDDGADIFGGEIIHISRFFRILGHYEYARNDVNRDTVIYSLPVYGESRNRFHWVYGNFSLSHSFGMVTPFVGIRYAKTLVNHSFWVQADEFDLPLTMVADTSFKTEDDYGLRMDIAWGDLRGTYGMVSYETQSFDKLFSRDKGLVRFRLNVAYRNSFVAAAVVTTMPELFNNNNWRFHFGFRL
ncbi:MAG: PEGA domain-containing protein [Calditrichaeota bacterium]|nr:PEGA domain-containing protein [Calditrichota bacterium]